MLIQWHRICHRDRTLLRYMTLRAIYVFITLTGMGFLMSGCEPDPCRDTFCSDGSECVDGHCFCLVGQYGDDCSSTYSGDLAGIYDVESVCDSNMMNYSSTISTVSDSPWLIRISNPSNSVDNDVRMEAIFSADGSLSIKDSTILVDGTELMVNGTIDVISDDSLIVTLYYNNELCQETYYR